jgi:hypothetical protein
MAQSAVKLLPQVIAGLVRFVLDMGAEMYVDELCSFHSSSINPNELSMGHTYYEEVAFLCV